jgi:hypothetical protein
LVRDDRRNEKLQELGSLRQFTAKTVRLAEKSSDWLRFKLRVQQLQQNVTVCCVVTKKRTIHGSQAFLRTRRKRELGFESLQDLLSMLDPHGSPFSAGDNIQHDIGFGIAQNG